jgi:hypothetical protein
MDVHIVVLVLALEVAKVAKIHAMVLAKEHAMLNCIRNIKINR